MKQEGEHEADVSRYEFSGIEERHGIIPKWLVAVYLVLFVWMVFYLIRFWTDHG